MGSLINAIVSYIGALVTTYVYGSTFPGNPDSISTVITFTRSTPANRLTGSTATIGIRIFRLAHRPPGCKETTFTSIRLLVRQNITYREGSYTIVAPHLVAAVVAKRPELGEMCAEASVQTRSLHRGVIYRSTGQFCAFTRKRTPRQDERADASGPISSAPSLPSAHAPDPIRSARQEIGKEIPKSPASLIAIISNSLIDNRLRF
jgi:hypothetical protein